MVAERILASQGTICDWARHRHGTIDRSQRVFSWKTIRLMILKFPGITQFQVLSMVIDIKCDVVRSGNEQMHSGGSAEFSSWSETVQYTFVVSYTK